MSRKKLTSTQAGTQKNIGERKTPIHVDPHSKWQLLILSKMKEKEISLRNLKSKFDTLGCKTTSSTINTWIHHPTGGPPLKRYNEDLNLAFSKVLSINAQTLAKVYDESVSRFPELSTPAPPYKNLSALLELFLSDPEDNYTTSEVVSIIEAYTTATVYLNQNKPNHSDKDIVNLAKLTLSSN